MRKAVLFRHDDIRIVDEDIPDIGDDDILVKVFKCGICTGELMDWYVDSKAPYTPGHEIVGIIERVGRNVKGFEPGERVMVHHHAPCMLCDFCISGDYVHCDTWRKSKIYPGGFSEYILVPGVIHKTDVLKVPDGISDDDAALVEPLATSFKAVKRAFVKPPQSVLGVGLGFMGILNIFVAQRFGADVFGVDINDERIDFARKFGLNAGRYEEIYGRKFDVVIVSPGSVKAIEDGLSYVRRGGKLVLFAPTPPYEVLNLNVNRVYFDEISIIPSYSAGPDDIRVAMRLAKFIKPSRFITHRVNLEELQEGFKIARKPSTLKVMVEINKSPL